MSDTPEVRPDVILNLSRLIANTPDVYEVEGEGLFMPSEDLLERDGLRLAQPLKWHMIARGTGGDDDYLLEGNVEGVAIMDCRRCLEQAVVESSSEFIYQMEYRPGKTGLELLEQTEDEDDLLIFGKPEVDFSELIAQVFAIDLPLTALCRDDCRGLSSDGTNLNEHPEHAANDVVADEKPSPFAVLKDIDV